MALTPRLDAYGRAISRLFEALILLDIFGIDTGPHITTIAYNPSNPAAARHRFLKNLAFVCDYKKGGETTTAIAVEDCPDAFMFWLASNEAGKVDVVGFLHGILTALKNALEPSDGPEADVEEYVTRRCTTFAIPRIKKEAKLLSNAATKCQKHLDDFGGKDKSLSPWLGQFIWTNGPPNLLSLCRIAYNERASPEMKIVESLSRDPADGSNATEIIMAYRRVRHFIGRLASHIRVPKQLLEDAPRVHRLLDSFRVDRIQPLTPVSAPQADAHTTLEGMLTRMLTNNNARLPALKTSLLEMDRQQGLKERVIEKYTDGFIPRVHAEIQLLEYFHRGKLSFAFVDRYVACSKPACLCCKLYFRHHPSNPVEPDSHERAHLKWSPPPLPNTNPKSPENKQQHNILLSVVKGLGQAVLEKIGNPRANVFPHPDSGTGITASDEQDWDSDLDGDMGFVSDELGFHDSTGLADDDASEEEDDGPTDTEEYYHSDSDGGAAV